MFEWKVEELKLYNQEDGIYLGKEKIYDCEREVSREDKIKFIDKMQAGKLSYVLNLAERFEIASKKMPKNKNGIVMPYALKKWIKQNDTRGVLEDVYDYGSIRMLCTRNIQTINIKGLYDTYDDYIDELFHRQLKECEYMEKRYFQEHDEYFILKRKFIDKYKYHTTFGVKIKIIDNKNIYIVEDGTDREREITIDELKYLLNKYTEIDNLIQEITEKTHIVY